MLPLTPAERLSRIAQMLSVGQAFTTSLLSSAATRILARNARRWGFTIGYTQGSGAFLWIDSSATSVKGFVLAEGTSPQTFRVEEHGGWVQGEIWVAGGGATYALSVIETVVTLGDFDQQTPLYQYPNGIR